MCLKLSFTRFKSHSDHSTYRLHEHRSTPPKQQPVWSQVDICCSDSTAVELKCGMSSQHQVPPFRLPPKHASPAPSKNRTGLCFLKPKHRLSKDTSTGTSRHTGLFYDCFPACNQGTSRNRKPLSNLEIEVSRLFLFLAHFQGSSWFYMFPNKYLLESDRIPPENPRSRKSRRFWKQSLSGGGTWCRFLCSGFRSEESFGLEMIGCLSGTIQESMTSNMIIIESESVHHGPLDSAKSP